MNNESQARQQAATTIIKNVAIKTGLIVGIAAVAALILLVIRHSDGPWWFLPASILFGGALGLLNFRWLAFAIERAIARKVAPAQPSNPLTTILNGFKLVAIFVVLFVVIKWQLVDIFGLIIGLSLCFLAIIWEGVTLIRSAQDGQGQ